MSGQVVKLEPNERGVAWEKAINVLYLCPLPSMVPSLATVEGVAVCLEGLIKMRSCE